VVAPGLAELVLLCVHRRPSPNSKVLRNLFTMACGDSAATARVPEADPDSDADDDSERRATGDAASTSEASEEAEAAATARRGAEHVIRHALPPHAHATLVRTLRADCARRCLARRAGQYLPETLPVLWELTSGALTAHTAQTAASPPPDLAESPETAQALVNALFSLQFAAPCLDTALHERFAADLAAFVTCLQHARRAVRTAAAAALVALVQAAPDVYLNCVITSLLPLIDVRLSRATSLLG